MHSHTQTKVTYTTLKRVGLAVVLIIFSQPALPGNRPNKAALLPPKQQIVAAVLPLPPVMREHATVIGYSPDLTLVTLRQGTNGMVCTADIPGDDVFDVRCYHESFMPVVRRM